MNKFKLILTIGGLMLIMPLASLQAQGHNPCEGLDLDNCQQDIMNAIGGASYGQVGNGDAASIFAFQAATLTQKIGLIINMILSFLGIVFLGLIIYSGYQWMIAAGNEEKVKESIERMIRAIIGLTIIVSAYVLTNFVVTRIQTSNQTQQEQKAS